MHHVDEFILKMDTCLLAILQATKEPLTSYMIARQLLEKDGRKASRAKILVVAARVTRNLGYFQTLGMVRAIKTRGLKGPAVAWALVSKNCDPRAQEPPKRAIDRVAKPAALKPHPINRKRS